MPLPTVNVSPNMSLPVPVTGVDPGPDWANQLNNCMNIIDGHNHTPGYGVPVPSAGLNINSDLTFQDNNATALRSARFQGQGAALSLAADLSCLYAVTGGTSGTDLYYNTGSGAQIAIVKNGAVAGTPGSIQNLTPPANVTYNNSIQTYIFQSAVNTPANLDGASIILRDLSINSHGVTIHAPASLGADYSLTVPPVSNTTTSSPAAVTIDSSGVMKSNLVLLYGGVDGASGNPNTGTGFSSSRSAQGVYQITWTVPFTQPPGIGISPANAQAFFTMTSVSANGFTMNTFNTSSLASDLTFYFTVIGRTS